MRCLNCNAEMVNYDVITKKAELSYDSCGTCGSLWLDAGELDKMAFQVEGSIEYSSEEEDQRLEKRTIRCPRCEDFPLSRVRFLGETGIFLHRCKNCGGFWLDGGALNLIDNKLAQIMPVSGHGFSDFVNNVHIPYWYKRVRRRSSETDFSVEVEPIRDAEHLKATGHRCPACGEALDLYSAFGMKFEGCPKCHGMWLVKDELRRLKNRTEEGRLHWLNDEIDNIERAAVIPTARPCVECKDARLLAVVFGKSSIVMDWCPKCHGIWLDRGEFDSIIEYLNDEATKATPADVEQEIVKDIKKLWAGGPESRAAEVADTAAAIPALVSATIFEHPFLFSLCMRAAEVGQSIGMD
jgi:Zn-finger nucleic acid-binding protein